MYDKPYTRMSPYLVGCLLAFGMNGDALREFVSDRRRLTDRWVLGLTAVCLAGISAALFGQYGNRHQEWPEWEVRG